MKSIARPIWLVAAAVSLMGGAEANAQITADIGGGAESGATYVNFDTLSSGSTANFVSGALTVSFSGNATTDGGTAPWLSGSNNVNFESPSTLPGGGQADATTWLNAGNLLSGSGPGAITFNFSSSQNYFGLVWGSIDFGENSSSLGNYLTFYTGPNGTGSAIETVDGTILAGLNSSIDDNHTDTGSTDITGTAYVNIDVPGGFQSVVATSGWFTFEMDNVAYGSSSSAPDGGMTAALLGGALVVLQLLRRRLFCSEPCPSAL